MPQLTLPTIDPHPSPPVPVRAPVGRPEDRTVQILGVEIIDVTQRRAVELVRHMIDSSDGGMLELNSRGGIELPL